MHPLLARKQALAFYVVTSLCFGGATALFFSYRGSMQWGSAAVLFPVLALLLAFIAISSWYFCKAYPLGRTDAWILILTGLATASISTLLWLGSGMALASFLSAALQDGTLTAWYSTALPFLFAFSIGVYLLAISIHYAILSLDAARQKEQNNLELQYLAQEAELKALRAQIDPHFLFNSLNSVSALTTSDPLSARLMCLRLADFLRNGLSIGSRSSIPLREELSLTSAYLDIEKIRFGARLNVNIQLEDACASSPVPPLLLQPLAENAVKHGITHLLEGGAILIEARASGDRLHVTMENPCDPERPKVSGERMGLELVRRRLHAQYGDTASMVVRETAECFRVELAMPANRNASSRDDASSDHR